MLTATIYDTHAEQLFDRIQQLHQLLTTAGVPYRIVGYGGFHSRFGAGSIARPADV